MLAGVGWLEARELGANMGVSYAITVIRQWILVVGMVYLLVWHCVKDEIWRQSLDQYRQADGLSCRDRKKHMQSIRKKSGSARTEYAFIHNQSKRQIETLEGVIEQLLKRNAILGEPAHIRLVTSGMGYGITDMADGRVLAGF